MEGHLHLGWREGTVNRPILEHTSFVAANTAIMTPPLVPEIKLHLAHEAVPLWHKTEEELGETGLPPPFWAFAWAGGQALARYVLDHPERVLGKRVVDLASGSGMVAIAAKLAGATSAMAADIDPFSMAAIERNARLNGVYLETNASDLLAAEPPLAGLILVGDFFYERDLAARTFVWLLKAMRNGASVLIGDPGRTYLPRASLEKLAEYAVPVTRDLEDQEIKRSAVWTIRSC